MNRHPVERRQVRPVVESCLQAFQCVAVAQGEAGLAVGQDGFDPGGLLVAARRVGRDGNRPGVQAAEESGDEIQPLGKNEQNALTHGPTLLEVSCNAAGSGIQFAVRQHLRRSHVVEKRVDRPRPMELCAYSQQGIQTGRCLNEPERTI